MCNPRNNTHHTKRSEVARCAGIPSPNKTLYDRFVSWSRMGVFVHILSGLAACAGESDINMIDASQLKAHHTAAILLEKEASPHHTGRTKGGLNSKLHALCNNNGRPLVGCLREGRLSQLVGVKPIYPVMPNAKFLAEIKDITAPSSAMR